MTNKNRFTINDTSMWSVIADGIEIGVGDWDIDPVHPVIPVGTGFTAVTPEIAGYGTAAGYDETAIARWAEMPYKTWELNTEYEIGVIAFHMNGIDRVEFSCNGGAWVTARGLVNNPRTGNREYWGKLTLTDANNVDAKGYVELRARVYPVGSGIPLVLQSPMWTGSEDTEPYRHRTNRSGLQSLLMLPAKPDKIIKYVSVNGDDTTGDGTIGSPYRNPQKAVDTTDLDLIGSAGLKIIINDLGVYEAPITFKRDNPLHPLEIEAGPGLSWSEQTDGVGVQLKPQDGTPIGGDPERFDWRPQHRRIHCTGIHFMIEHIGQLYGEVAEDTDPGVHPEKDATIWMFSDCKFEDSKWNWVRGDWLRTSQSYPIRANDSFDGGGNFVENSTFFGVRYGACGLDMVRNTHQEAITHDSMARTTFSVDCTCRQNQLVNDDPATRDPSLPGGAGAYELGNPQLTLGTGASIEDDQTWSAASPYNRNLWHCDHFQIQGRPSNNIIHFGFQATEDRDVQNILIGKTDSAHSNQAFVNCIFENLEGTIIVVSQHASWARHILFENLTILDQSTVFRPDFDHPKPLSSVHEAVEWLRPEPWMQTSEYQLNGRYHEYIPWRSVKPGADVGDHWDSSDPSGKPGDNEVVLPNQAFIAKNFIIRNCVFEAIRSEAAGAAWDNPDPTYPLNFDMVYKTDKLPPGVRMISCLDADQGSGSSVPSFDEQDVVRLSSPATDADRISLVYTPVGVEGSFPGTWSYEQSGSGYTPGLGSYRKDIHRSNTSPQMGYLPKDPD